MDDEPSELDIHYLTLEVIEVHYGPDGLPRRITRRQLKVKRRRFSFRAFLAPALLGALLLAALLSGRLDLAIELIGQALLSLR